MTNETETTTHRLNSLIKSARDIMRQDKGLNGDLDRLPQLIWVMFLKFLDDMERASEQEAELSGKKYRPAIQAPYRWRDWAAHQDGITGDELLAFVSQEEAERTDGTRGQGLLVYLRKLQSANGRDRRDIIASVFGGVLNRMINGYLLRDLINKIDEIDFNSSVELHTLGHLYETMLQQMRDAAGDSGEFYTPRPVVRFMVAACDPQLGESVLDPACGTGGFLTEAFKHISDQCETVEERETLQLKTIFGQEAKPLAYMLCQMNLLLHGVDYPHIQYGNSLAVRLSELGDHDRVDIILSNPPFGGVEEPGIKANFPHELQVSETALLFLQLIMRKLRRKRSGSCGRAAVILPTGILSQGGVAERVRMKLIKEFNLHTVVRLPRGVFEPYTRSSTSILFFNTDGKTSKTWYYQVPVREGVKV